MGIMMLAFLSFVVIVVVCEFFQRTTDHFKMVGDAFCSFDWYLLPIDMQRILIMVMANAQQPITIRGFANTSCVRVSVKSVN